VRRRAVRLARIIGDRAATGNSRGFSVIIAPEQKRATGGNTKMMIRIALSAFAAAAFFAGTGTLHAAGGDPVAGKAKTAMCAGCHGIPNYKTAFPEVYHVPKIGGQHAAYIVKALQAYRSGERTHPTMRAIAKDLSDQDMADLAAYYASESTRSAAR
jgi:cytochrome c553